jgi:nitroreductase
MLKDIILRNRSYRRFYQQEPISIETIMELIDLARCSPCAANLQELKYIISNGPARNEAIFSCLSWAGYLSDWHGPAEGEKPAAYIVILGDTLISANFTVNHGIACHSILLGAVEKGLGGCIVGSIDRDTLRHELSIAPQFEILLVLALGKPREEVILEDVDSDGNIRYWRDEHQRHHVPKRKLIDIIIKTYSSK